MNNLCPACGLKFEREPGYFLGAMYVSYAFAAILITILSFIVQYVFPGLELHWVVLIAGAGLVPFVPAIFRYSRVIWMMLDRAIDPD